MPPAITVPLPAASLRVAFAGDKKPIISGIAPDSPVSHHMKPGFEFVSLKMGDGVLYEDLDTFELVALLNDSQEDPDRQMKLKMCLPESSKVVLGAGEHGLVIEDKGDKPIITRCLPDSPVIKDLRVGMVIDSVQLMDGFTATGHTAEEINALLGASSEDDKRILSLINPEADLSSRSVELPKFKNIELPPGSMEELGFKLKGQLGEIATITAVSDAVPGLRPGLCVSALTLPEGHQLHQLQAKNLALAIDESAESEGRVIALKNPSLVKMPIHGKTKVMLPDDGTLEEFGFECAGDPAEITNVVVDSPFEGLVFKGFQVMTIGWTGGSEFDDLDAGEVDDVLANSQGHPGRFMYLKNMHALEAAEELEEMAEATAADPYVYVDLPASKLGLSFIGQPPSITKISPKSPIADEVEIGFIAHSLTLADGTVYDNMDTLQLTDALKGSSSEEGRQICFIKKDVPVSPIRGGGDGSLKEVPLPAGKLGITFKGNTPAIISRVKPDSPLVNEGIEGMGVDSITVKNREHMQMNAVQVASLIKSTSDESNRILKVRDADSSEFQKIPENLEVVLPAGTIGVTFASTPPVCKAFKDDSPVGNLIPPGTFVDALKMPDGYTQTGFSAKELVTLLGGFKGQEGRTLVLKNLKTETPTPKGEIFPESKEVELPVGKIGVSFKGKRKTIVSRVHSESPLLGIVYVGMEVESIEVPGSSKFEGMTGKEVARTLVDTKNVEGRMMVIKAPSGLAGDGLSTASSGYSQSQRG